jgi:hypothetical protein
MYPFFQQGVTRERAAEGALGDRKVSAKMPRTRKPSAFPRDHIEGPQSRLGLILSSEASVAVATDGPRTSRDPMKFVRAMAEIERLRGLRVHPESPTLH